MGKQMAVKHPLGFEPSELLGTLGTCRSALIAAQGGMRRKSGLYRGADAVIAEIDELALILTGDRTYFYAPGHAEQMRHVKK